MRNFSSVLTGISVKANLLSSPGRYSSLVSVFTVSLPGFLVLFHRYERQLGILQLQLFGNIQVFIFSVSFIFTLSSVGTVNVQNDKFFSSY